jgi:hypothetical protein
MAGRRTDRDVREHAAANQRVFSLDLTIRFTKD